MTANGSTRRRKAPPALDETVRRRLNEWIENSGLSQERLARSIGKTQAWVSRYQRGKRGADLDTLQRLAEAFGRDLAELFAYPKNTNPEEVRLLSAFRAARPSTRALLLQIAEEITRP